MRLVTSAAKVWQLGCGPRYLVGLVGTHTAASAEPQAIVSRREPRPLPDVAGGAAGQLVPGKARSGHRQLDYCSAGHPPALLLRANGQLESLSEGGPLLGVVPAASFAGGRVELRTGDVLLVCSDGILESLNSADQEFGYERLEAQLRRARTDSADAVLFSVLGAVQDFAAARPLVDDMSLVVVRQCSVLG